MDTSIDAVSAATKKMLSTFKSQRREAEAALMEIVQRRLGLEAEREQITASPASREDFIAALCSQVEAVAGQGRARMNQAVWGHQQGAQYRPVSALSPYDFAWSRVQDVASGKSQFGSGGMALIANADSRNQVHAYTFDGVAMCALFEEQIKASLRANLCSFDWPFPDAQPSELRLQRLQEIERELATLAAQEDQLSEALADAIAG